MFTVKVNDGWKMSDDFEAQGGAESTEPQAVEQDAQADGDAGIEQAEPEAIDWSDMTKATDVAFRNMALVDREAAEDLRRRWGPDAPANLQFARAFAKAHPDLVQRLAVYGDAPELIEAAAHLGRLYAAEPGNPDTVQRMKPMEVAKMEEVQDRIDELREARNKALSRNDHSKAERIDRQMRELYGRIAGNEPAVGTAGRWA